MFWFNKQHIGNYQVSGIGSTPGDTQMNKSGILLSKSLQSSEENSVK